MDNSNKDEINLRTFNTAKFYAEKILFPKMDLYQLFQRQADFGCQDLGNSLEIPEEIRNIERYNGLKGMCEILNNLLINISSTVKLKNNKEEIEQLKKLINLSEKVKLIFYEHKERFFDTIYKDMNRVEILNRTYFDQIRKIIDTCYINTEILMTRNKLLFSDSNDEYSSDQEIKEQILKEYVEG